MDPESSPTTDNQVEHGREIMVDAPETRGPWEELAAGARQELEKWAESRRDRRRERRAGGTLRPRRP